MAVLQSPALPVDQKIQFYYQVMQQVTIMQEENKPDQVDMTFTPTPQYNMGVISPAIETVPVSTTPEGLKPTGVPTAQA